MRTLLFHPRPAVLTGSKFRREPVRPKEHQSADFADKFDDRTLLFDSFFRGDNEVLIVAPPFFNLLPFVRRWTSIAPSRRSANSASGIWIGTRRSRCRANWHKRLTALTAQSLRTRVSAKSLNFEAASHLRCRRTTNCNGSRLGEIQSRHHGMTPSSSMTTNPRIIRLRIVANISEISGIERVCVVWPFLYGPQGLDATRF